MVPNVPASSRTSCTANSRGSIRSGRAVGNDNVGTEMHKFRSQQVEGFGVFSAKAVLEFEILTVDIAQVAKACL